MMVSSFFHVEPSAAQSRETCRCDRKRHARAKSAVTKTKYGTAPEYAY